jgi:hypothetical protein
MKRLLTLVLLLLASSALAHDKNFPVTASMHDWFMTLKSGKGPCCADADGNVVKDSDWESVNDAAKPTVHYKVFLEGAWQDVPDEAVILTPNLYGQTMVWPNHATGWGGVQNKLDIRCFMPGVMG